MVSAKNTTIRDVAAAAGVSITTISRVLNQSPIPTEETRARVLEVVQQLNYVSQKPGRKSRHPERTPKRSRLTHTVGLLLSANIMERYSQGDPYYARLLGGIYQGADQSHSHLMVGLYDRNRQVLPPWIMQNKVDGLLIDAEVPPPIQLQLSGRMPVVFLDSGPAHPTASSVEPNLEAAVTETLDHLWDLNHRDIALFLPRGEARLIHRLLAAYATFFQMKNHRPRLDLLNAPRDISAATHRQVLERYAGELAAARPRPTALVSWDIYSGDILAALERQGTDVPREISVVGFDDLPLAAQSRPPMTSYRFPMDEIGRLAVETLQQIIIHPAGPVRKILLTGRLVVRDSTGPASTSWDSQ